MSILSSISTAISDVAGVITDPGKLVGDALEVVLPQNLKGIGEVAAAAIDFASGPQAAAAGIKHSSSALGDLPQLAKGLSGDPGAPAGTAAAEPSPPPGSSGTAAATVSLAVPAATASTASAAVSGAATTATSHVTSTSSAKGTASTTSATSSAAPDAAKTTAASSASSSSSSKTTSASSSDSAASKTSSSSTSSSSSASESADLKKLLAMSPDQFIQAVTGGKLPDDVANSPTAMMQLQAKMNEITQMNQIVTQMMAAEHQMQMSIIQNIRC